jgi:flagellar hook-associated protein 3 FlgL
MRIPTYINSRHQADMLNRQYDLVNRLQTKISSGKKLIDSSDDPVLASTIKATKDYIAHLDTYKNNLIIGQARSKVMEAGVSGSINSVTRAAELVKAAQSDTTNNADRLNMAKELEGIVSSLMGYMNTRDANGDYVFSGTNTKSQSFAFVNGAYEYLGSYEQATINVSPTTSIIYNENGQSVFGDMRQGNGSVVISQGSVPNVGSAETSVATTSNISAYPADTYTLTFVTNSSGKLAYQVIGAVGGQIIPAPPQTSPADAPEYQAGNSISLNGINFTINGDPALGDNFVIAPSKKQNILETLRQTIEVLKSPVTSSVEKAAYHQKIGELSASISGAGTYLTHYLSEVGYREREIETQDSITSADMLTQKTLLDKYESADQFELISDLTASMTSLQLTQQVHTKLQEFFETLLKNIV